MKWRKLAVCTVGVVLALLLGGLFTTVDRLHSVVDTASGVVYAAQSGTAPACPEVGIPISGVVSEKCTFKAGCHPKIVISPNGEVTIEIECSVEIICDF